MNIVDWTIAPGNWPEIGPEIAASLKRIATMPLGELRAMPRIIAKQAIKRGRNTIADIQFAVCEEFSIDHTELMSAAKNARIAVARQVAMFLARELTHKTFAQIGSSFFRDHTTVCHACRVVMSRPELAPVIARLRAELAP